MKVLMVHNRYQQRGGEDSVVDAEVRLLRTNGIAVERFDVDNDDIHGIRGKIQVSANFLLGTGAEAAGERLSATLDRFQPDIVHVHNWFPTLSPSVFRRCRSAKVPVVHTLHNYRLLCVNAMLARDGHVCEECIGTTLRTPGMLHKCYRGSYLGSAVATAGMLAEWSAGTWHHSVDRFIALSEFSRKKLVQGGLPADKIVVKPNFVDPDPGVGSGDGGYFLYAGRLTEEKGLRTLLQCWKNGADLAPLKIVGAGPLQGEVAEAASTVRNVEWLGNKSGDEVLNLMARAKATLCPSLWYEAMPRVVIESLAVGTPVIASRIGSYPEMLADGESGTMFIPGDSSDLLFKLRALEQTKALRAMRPTARLSFEAQYTGSRNFSMVVRIYQSAMVTEDRLYSVPISART